MLKALAMTVLLACLAPAAVAFTAAGSALVPDRIVFPAHPRRAPRTEAVIVMMFEISPDGLVRRATATDREVDPYFADLFIAATRSALARWQYPKAKAARTMTVKFIYDIVTAAQFPSIASFEPPGEVRIRSYRPITVAID